MVEQPFTDTHTARGDCAGKSLWAVSLPLCGGVALESNPGDDRTTIALGVVIPEANGFWSDP